MSAAAADAIAATVAAWTGGADPAALIRTAERESRLTPDAVGDNGKSWGLYQLMPKYWLKLWDENADPRILFNPYVATVVAGRIWNKAVEAGARDFIQVRLYWGYGPSGLKYGPESEPYQKRLQSKWSIVDGVLNPPVSRFDYRAFGTGPQPDQDAKLRSIGGLTPVKSGGSMLVKLLLGYLAWRYFA